ncbi:MAG: DUF1292 domain-containing protein [Lachnospiraceae bacterium]|nr:DUF1292 domain-containing protein [Candidatus Merdinaster equi]
MFQKVTLTPTDGETIDLYVIEQTRVAGVNYLLVTEEESGDGEAMILKDLSADTDEESVYEFVDDDATLQTIGAIFADMLEDIDVV